MFRINPLKTYREEKFVSINKARASVRTNLITISQPYVITKKDVNFDSNCLSSTGVDNTAKTRRPQPRSNTKNDKVPSASKSSCIKNKEVEVEEHHRNLLLSKNQTHMSSKCNNIRLAIQNDKSEVVCAMYKQCLITSNHDVCVLNYVNDMNSRAINKNANVSNVANQKKRSKERLALPKPSKPRSCLSSKGDNVCASNPQEPISKRFPNLTFSLEGNSKMFMVLRLGMLKAHDRKSEASQKYHLEVSGNRLLKFKYHKEYLCPSCKQGKSKKASHPPKPVPCSKQRLHLLHMDLCGPMRVESINGKRYVLVIMDDYSRYTWVHFLRTKDEAPDEIKTFLKKITVLLQAPVIIVRIDNVTEFKNQVLQEYFKSVGISHQSSSVRTS
ncbi:retrovirus-related pol polyprotein from transposon TNT 1-94 [Tanacetum coccineum]